MSDAYMRLVIDGADTARFTRAGDDDSLEFAHLGPVTGVPHVDLEPFFEHAWDETPDGGTAVGMAGWSRYEQDEMHAYARGYTALVPGATATVTLEWHGEGGPLREVRVYRDGDRVDGTHTEDVTDDLPELLLAVRDAIDASAHAAEGDSNDAEADAAAHLRDTAGALAEALERKAALPAWAE